MTIRPWTTSELLTLSRMAADGATRAEIAAELGRTIGAVASQVCRSRIIHREQIAWTERDDAELVRQITNGRSVIRIAIDTGRTEKSIRARLDRIGVRLREFRRAA